MNDINDIKKLRKKINLTQTELADECGVTLRTVQNWEKGETIPESKRKLLESIVEKYEKISQNILGNTNNIKSNNINSDETIMKIAEVFEKQLRVKDEQISKSQEQIDRLISLLEKEKTK